MDSLRSWPIRSFGSSLAALAAFTLSLVSTSPAASEPGRGAVVLLELGECCGDLSWPAAEELILAEIEAMGLDVLGAPARGEDPARADLAGAGIESGAMCAVAIYFDSPEGDAVLDVWARDEESGDSVQRHIALGPRSDRDAASIAAIRAVEALRASLQELNLDLIDVDVPEPEPEPQIEEEEPAEEVEAKPRPEPEPEKDDGQLMLGIGVGGSGLGSPGGVDGMGGVQILLAWRPWWWLSIHADALLTVLGDEISDGGASSTFDLATFRGWIMWEIRPEGILRPAVGIGGGGVIFWSTGSGDGDQFDMRTDRAAVGYVGAAAHLGVAVSDWFWVRAGARVGIALPEVVLEFGSSSVARFGRPMVEGFLNLEIYFL